MPDHSRLLRLASSAAHSEPRTLAARLSDTHVHISAEVDTHGVEDALRTLVRNMRQLPIGLSVSVQTGSHPDIVSSLLDELKAICRGVDADRPLQATETPVGAIGVHLGTSPGRDTILAAVPDGHGARVRVNGDGFPADVKPASGLGSVLTAALVSAEVFKVVTGLSPESRSAMSSFDFCPVTLTDQVGLHHDPVLTLDGVALLGCGAIGTAIALILSLLRTTGIITAVDPEQFDDPNLITYSLGTDTDARTRTAKTALVDRALPNVVVTPLDIDIQTYIELIDKGKLPFPCVILNGLDTIEARHDAARLHADLTLDGSTGGATGTTVGVRVAQYAGPCLRCFYPDVPATPTLADLTGLPPELLRNGDAVVDDDLLAAADSAHRPRLERLKGQRVCALARLLTEDDDPDSFRPSASFVAQLAASLVVGALIAEQHGIDRHDSREVEFDALFGWNADAAQPRQPRHTCACQVDRDLILQVRNQRAQPR